MRTTRFIWFLIMIAIGAAFGLYYTWVVDPVEFVDATFHHLRQDYKTDYVLMVAEIYDSDHVLYQAMIRLDLLEETSAEDAVNAAIQTARGFGYADVDLNKMTALRSAIVGGVSSPTPEIDLTLAENLLMTETNQPEPGTEITETAAPGSDPNILLPTLESNPFGAVESLGISTATQSVIPVLTPETSENDSTFFRKADDSDG